MSEQNPRAREERRGTSGRRETPYTRRPQQEPPRRRDPSATPYYVMEVPAAPTDRSPLPLSLSARPSDGPYRNPRNTQPPAGVIPRSPWEPQRPQAPAPEPPPPPPAPRDPNILQLMVGNLPWGERFLRRFRGGKHAYEGHHLWGNNLKTLPPLSAPGRTGSEPAAPAATPPGNPPPPSEGPQPPAPWSQPPAPGGRPETGTPPPAPVPPPPSRGPEAAPPAAAYPDPLGRPNPPSVPPQPGAGPRSSDHWRLQPAPPSYPGGGYPQPQPDAGQPTTVLTGSDAAGGYVPTPIERDRPDPTIESHLFSTHIGGARSQGDRPSQDERYAIVPSLTGREKSFFVGVYDGERDPQGRDIITHHLDLAVREEIGRGHSPDKALERAYKRLLHQRPIHERGLNAINAVRQGDKLYVTTLGNGQTKAVLNRNGQPYTERVLSNQSSRDSEHLWKQEVDLRPEDKQLILASDGLWEAMSESDAVTLIKNVDNPKEASERLADEARRIYRAKTGNSDVPNITILVVNLQHGVPYTPERPKPRPPADTAAALAIPVPVTAEGQGRAGSPIPNPDTDPNGYDAYFVRRINGLPSPNGPSPRPPQPREAVIEYPRNVDRIRSILGQVGVAPDAIISQMEQNLRRNEPFALVFERDGSGAIVGRSETAQDLVDKITQGIANGGVWGLWKSNRELLTTVLTRLGIDDAIIRTRLDDLARHQQTDPNIGLTFQRTATGIELGFGVPDMTQSGELPPFEIEDGTEIQSINDLLEKDEGYWVINQDGVAYQIDDIDEAAETVSVKTLDDDEETISADNLAEWGRLLDEDNKPVGLQRYIRSILPSNMANQVIQQATGFIDSEDDVHADEMSQVFLTFLADIQERNGRIQENEIPDHLGTEPEDLGEPIHDQLITLYSNLQNILYPSSPQTAPAPRTGRGEP